MGFGLGTVLVFTLSLLALFLLAPILKVPIGIVMKLIVNGLIGGLTLLLVNLVGGIFGINIAITYVTALIAGFLGLPGVLILLIFNIIQ